MPVGIQWPILVALVIASIVLVVILQLLLNAQQRNGGLIFAPSVEAVSDGNTFTYLYLPVILSTALALSWTWVDTGSKRAEPYFQLSKMKGESGDLTVLLDYATDFIAMVPIRAIRRR